MAGVERTAERRDYRIDLTTQHDLIEVVEIEDECQLSAWGWEAYNVELTRPEAVMLVARRYAPDWRTGKSLQGFVAARVAAEELHINNIGVRAAARGRGVGGALLRAAIATGRRLGAHAAVLEVRASNLAAQALYRRCGFNVAGRRRNYYRDPPEDALIMTAAL
ncbi:MAG TPA: ribosomal protein S18-alanine N-acetyltransferase [Pyrinomonadaceae bacterium]|jgi:ribosomal-protein-alanine N-acetyltransferase